jgi:hypothetical protein
VSWLHRGSLNSDPLFKGARGNQYNLNDARPVFEVVESPGGLYIGARRNAEGGHYYWRITPWVMPSFTMIPPRGDHPVHGHFWIPIDDHNCWTWSFDYHSQRALTETELQAMRDGKGIYVRFEPGTYRPLANKDNDYLIDRAAQKAGITFSGVAGIAMQDASLQESMGPDRRSHQGESCFDRQRNHHGASPHAQGNQGADGKRHCPAGCRSGAPSRALGCRDSAARPALHRRRQGSARGSRRHRTCDDLACVTLGTAMLSECARAPSP